ncbi:hypothetical protein VQ02_33430 [Methylobacterium variabile]|jgi:AraC-like DNA-binding protein|uniref:Transposase IS701-like DDE domain-containing protein n=1 Tax=Methylobacterium variabile TaxID=298794 RepID=A0A0J6S0Z5_9HYPH|nr:hypothetical protein VQ02_33430 [Methylobacterium variabile]
MTRAGVPEDRREARTKLEIAVAEIDWVREGGLRSNCVLADAGYGSTPFRQAMSARGLTWAVRISGRSKVYHVAREAGFGTPLSTHQQFAAQLGILPMDFRRTFCDKER